jgi:oxygen-dependent protoporphyrinogen oxidase
MFMSLHGGLQQLVDTLVAQLPPKAFRMNCRVLTVSPHGNQYRIALSDGSNILADDIIFATPAYVTADLVQEIDPILASRLRAIRYVSTATVSLGFKRSDITHPLDGFGFVVPHSEGRKITACSWSSEKFSHRAPDDCALLRVFVGGARAEGIAEQDEATLIQLARQELQTIMGITATPILAKAYRWHKANPQYDLGHRARIAEIEQFTARHTGFHLAGAAYHGAGIPDCIQSGMKTALGIVKELAHSNSTSTDVPLPVSIQH